MRRKNEQVIGPSDGYDIENSATHRSNFFRLVDENETNRLLDTDNYSTRI